MKDLKPTYTVTNDDEHEQKQIDFAAKLLIY